MFATSGFEFVICACQTTVCRQKGRLETGQTTSWRHNIRLTQERTIAIKYASISSIECDSVGVSVSFG